MAGRSDQHFLTVLLLNSKVHPFLNERSVVIGQNSDKTSRNCKSHEKGSSLSNTSQCFLFVSKEYSKRRSPIDFFQPMGCRWSIHQWNAIEDRFESKQRSNNFLFNFFNFFNNWDRDHQMTKKLFLKKWPTTTNVRTTWNLQTFPLQWLVFWGIETTRPIACHGFGASGFYGCGTLKPAVTQLGNFGLRLEITGDYRWIRDQFLFKTKP
jgi:hypothetical protein